ncbi:MAG: HTTM domain-containing protein [Candidatus Kapaibacterium sp.]|nr:MAG: HTTM domain-containing protein [Candidatus Kapabacteria bacterium]
MKLKIIKYFAQTSSSAPLAVFRVLFGAAMVLSTARFLALGWVREQYIAPKVHFPYYGFEWIKPLQEYGLPEASMYAVFGAMLLAALGIMLGAWYRVASVAFFLVFTYVELLDKTYYLNHYYFVSVMSFVLMLLPAHRTFSLDIRRKPALERDSVPRWMIDVVKFQVGIVYAFAGIAKINSDWLFRAMPLAIWLPANDTMPIVGWALRYKETAYLFSWVGMLFDCTIPFWLSWKRSRVLAYTAVVVFHTLTGWMFQIGVFPLVMCLATPIFFSEEWHKRVVAWLQHSQATQTRMSVPLENEKKWRWTRYILITHCFFQLLIPCRIWLYDGNMFWTEEGYRFGWRVMLMEKAGDATFFVKDAQTGREGVALNREFLNTHQEKQMAMQPDMILHFAKVLKKHYAAHGMANPRVRAEVYVTLNGRPSRLYIDSSIDLTRLQDDFSQKKWILPFRE